MKRIIIALLITLSFNAAAQEEDVKKKFDFNGSVDAYYRINTNAPNDENQIAPGTSFADTSGFSLGMVNAIASYEGKKVGFTADLVFGPKGEAASSTVLNQLFMYWNISESTKITLGKFNTYLGYEVITPTGNFNYSTSYLFSNGPFSHTGIKVDFTLSDDVNLMLGVMNQTDVTEYNPDGSYALGAQLEYANHHLNLLYDKAGLGFEIDYTARIDLSDDFFLGIDASYSNNEGNGFTGAALYPQLETSDNFTLGFRGEYFITLSDTNDNNPNILAATLTGSYTVEDLIIKPELRLDVGSDDFFIDADSNPSNNLASFLVAAIYKF